jgi:acetyl esterase/lipase
MIYEVIKLKEKFPVLTTDATLTTYCLERMTEMRNDSPKKAVIVIPGGGYTFVSQREAEPVVIKFLAEGFNVFLLDYTVTKKQKFVYPYPLVEVFAALAHIRRNAERYNILKDHISLIGFSAGGHLAVSCAEYWQEDYYAKYLGVTNEEIKVNGVVAAYAVITGEEPNYHGETIRNISQNKSELIEYFTLNKHITKDFPPAFIWTTAEDTIVPPINSKLLADALEEKGIKHQFVLYQHGDHGLSTAESYLFDDATPEFLDYIKDVKSWVKLSADFLKENC